MTSPSGVNSSTWLGAAGWGTPVTASQPVTTLATALIPGHYGYLSTDPAAPSVVSGMVIVQKNDVLSLLQVASPNASALVYRRYSSDGGATWSLWAATSVSGVDVGNGDFTKFSSGLMIATKRLAMSAAGAITWTYPAVFTAAPRISGSITGTVLAALVCESAPGTSSVALSARGLLDARLTLTADIVAIGPWV